jgi:hypothetical protein
VAPEPILFSWDTPCAGNSARDGIRLKIARQSKGKSMPSLSRVGFVLCVLLGLLAAAPARATELEPGLWQDTETGTENGQPVKDEVTTQCMTPEDAKDPVKALMAEKAQADCKTFDVKPSGNMATFKMQCGDPKQMSFDIAGTISFIDRKHYTGTLKSTIIFAGQKMLSDKNLDSKWIGACKN